jgi:hypothetical protein
MLERELARALYGLQRCLVELAPAAEIALGLLEYLAPPGTSRYDGF